MDSSHEVKNCLVWTKLSCHLIDNTLIPSPENSIHWENSRFVASCLDFLLFLSQIIFQN